MSHYKQYSAYKDSGVEWIGRVPEHWETLRTKRAASLRNERRKDAPDGWTYIGLEDVEPESGRYAPTASESRQLKDSMVGVFHTGDVLYGKLRPYLRKAIVAEQDGVCSTEFLVLGAGRATASWLHHWLLTPDVTQQIEAGCDGAKMPRADWDHVGSIPVPLPPEEEQSTITTALDRETARIDALVAKKARFIGLLKEKRQALITHAVTKGLDPIVKMKDSGVEWIGKVPEHWIVQPVKRLIQQGTSISYGIVQPGEPLSEGVPFVQTTNMTAGQFDLEALQKTSPEIESSYPRSRLNGGEVLLGIRASIGATYMAPISLRGANLSRGVARIECGQKIDPSFLVEYLRSLAVSSYWQLAKQGSTFNEVSIETVRELPVVIPPLDEQTNIVGYLKTRMSRIERLSELTQESITLLKERRSALITSAVTGQIDLRDALP